jgi:large subunit ribosomal protein L15
VKLHDLKPAPGSRKARQRVGRGIAGGKGKTAGLGTKGQKSRAGGTIPAWFEGGQTPAHIRVPKLHGFKQRGRIDYQVVNVGRISEYAAAGRFGAEAGSSPLTINMEVLLGAGLISTERRPVKVLGHGDVGTKLFVAADAFTRSARSKIEGAGGFVQMLAPERAPAPEPEPAAGPAAAAEAPVTAAATIEPKSAADSPRARQATPAEPKAPEVGSDGDAAGNAPPSKPAKGEHKAAGSGARAQPKASAGARSEASGPATKTTSRATAGAASTRGKKGAARSEPDDDDAPGAKRGRTRKPADSADA